MYLDTVRAEYNNRIHTLIEISAMQEINSDVSCYEIIESIIQLETYHDSVIPELLETISDTLDINSAMNVGEHIGAIDWLSLLKEMKLRGIKRISPLTALYFYEFIKQGIIDVPGLASTRFREWVNENYKWIDDLYDRSRNSDDDYL